MKAPAPVTLASVTVQDIVSHFEYVGSVEAPLSVQIAPKVTGRIDFLQVKEGDHVSKGQMLVRLDPSDVQAQVQQQRATLAQAKYRLAQAQITQDPTNVSATTQIKQQEAVVASARADVKTARANLEDAKLKYERSQDPLRQRLRGPAGCGRRPRRPERAAGRRRGRPGQSRNRPKPPSNMPNPIWRRNRPTSRISPPCAEDIAAAQGGLKNLESKLPRYRPPFPPGRLRYEPPARSRGGGQARGRPSSRCSTCGRSGSRSRFRKK